jgi:hypothetical protein
MDVLQEARDKIEQRIAELREERDRLQIALRSLSGGSAPKRRGRPPGRPSTASTAAEVPSAPSGNGRKRRKGRKRRGGTRADHAVALIAEKPGISASEIAKKLKIKPNYLYRVLGDLEKQGRVKKDGRAYHPSAAT